MGTVHCICICSDGWSLLPNTLRPSKIYCARQNLGILLRGLFFQTRGSLTSLKSQLKVSPGGLVFRIFTSWKNPSTSGGFEPANLESRGEHITPRPPRPTFYNITDTDCFITVIIAMYVNELCGFTALKGASVFSNTHSIKKFYNWYYWITLHSPGITVSQPYITENKEMIRLCQYSSQRHQQKWIQN